MEESEVDYENYKTVSDKKHLMSLWILPTKMKLQRILSNFSIFSLSLLVVVEGGRGGVNNGDFKGDFKALIDQ